MKKLTLTAVITVVLILSTTFCISGTVNGKDKGDIKAQAQYYLTAEQEYVKEIRSLLEEKGYGNSGITMNRVIQEDGRKEYIITIHHKRIGNLSDDQKYALVSECYSINFPVENCSICYKFFETDL